MKSPVSLHVVVALMGASLLPRTVAAQPAPDAEPIPLVEVYGTLVPFLSYGHTTSATPVGSHVPNTTGPSQVATYSGVNLSARGNMDPSTTNIGFRGGVELMPNLSVTWQVENAVPIDGSAGANTWASRNTNVGLTGSWGTLFYGNWDTPYSWTTKTMINPIRSGNMTDFNAIINNPGFGVPSVTTQPTRAVGAADAAWERRQGNSVQYWTPNISGVSGRLMYSTDEGRTAMTAMAPEIGPKMLSGALAIDALGGNLKLREAAEVHFDYFGMSQLGGTPGATNTNRSSTDWGNKVIASYTNPLKGMETRVVGVAEFLSYKNKDSQVGANNEYSRWAFYGLVEQAFGQHRVWLGFGKAFEGDCAKVQGTAVPPVPACITTGLSATDGVVGYIFRASKAFDIWAAYYRISNDFASTHTSSPALGATPAPGTIIEAFGVGVLYTFSAKIIGPPPKAAAKPAEPPPPTPTPAPTTEPGPVPPPNAPEPPPNPGTPPPPTPNPNPNPNA
jgi:predicted porin